MKTIYEKTINVKTIYEKIIYEKTIYEKTINEKTIYEKTIYEKTINVKSKMATPVVRQSRVPPPALTDRAVTRGGPSLAVPRSDGPRAGF